MAISQFQSTQYMADKFVESAGAVFFRMSTKQIGVLHLLQKDEYVLAKGRRNCGETRHAAALREVFEESGYYCTLLPLDMMSRCPPAVGETQSEDVPRDYNQISEPFALQIRQLSAAGDEVKIIWWYVAAIDEEVKPIQHPEDGETFAVELVSYDDAINKLTFLQDREIAQKAIELVSKTYGCQAVYHDQPLT